MILDKEDEASRLVKDITKAVIIITFADKSIITDIYEQAILLAF